MIITQLLKALLMNAEKELTPVTLMLTVWIPRMASSVNVDRDTKEMALNAQVQPQNKYILFVLTYSSL